MTGTATVKVRPPLGHRLVTGFIGGTGHTLFWIFLVLQLTDNIHWSWWWVFSPLLATLVLPVIVLGVISLFENWGTS